MSSNTLTAVKGMNDIRPGADESFLDSAVWVHLHEVAAQVMASYGYSQVWLPVVEETALFTRGIGADTDIVSKEMYSFSDRGERQLTLRPEGTAGAARAYVQHNLARNDTVQRWWYAGPMFRAERPQKGRYRQFYQIGAEFFGVADVAADVEMLLLLRDFCAALKLPDVAIRINTLGDAESRKAYRTTLQAFLRSRAEQLCDSCRGRIDTNPLRVLDCKRPACRAVVADAPDILASLSPKAAADFERAQTLLQGAGLQYTRDPRLVRGLDYYTGLIFEFTTGALGAQDAILGGGRYDTLVEELGGASTPAVGFAAGVERLALLLTSGGQVPTRGPHLYLAPMDAAALPQALALAHQIRALGAWRVEVDVSGGRLKQQMRRADRAGAQHALVLGADELQTGRGKLKDLRTSTTTADVSLDAASLVRALQA